VKRLYIPLMIILALALILPACSASTTTTGTAPATTTAPAKDAILVGMSRPLSGPNQSVGDSAFKPIYDYFVKLWNDQGGLNVGGKKMKIVTKIYDNKSDIPTMTKQTEQLIVQDKVDFLWPSCSTADIFAQAPIANKYNKVLLTMEGGATSLEGMLPSMPYVFISLSFSDWYEMPVLADLLSSKGVKSAYVCYINDLHGIEYSGVAGIELGKKGINIVANKALPVEMTDFSLVIKDAKASGADAFLAFTYPFHVLPITGQMMSLNYNPKAVLFGPGANFGFYHTTYKSAANGVMYWGTWNQKMGPAFVDMYKALYPAGVPEDANDWWGASLYFGAMQFWKQAVEKAGTLDNTVVQQVMATSHFQTVLGDTFFTNGLMAKESHPGEIGQWQNDYPEIVGGNHPTAPFLYPKPNWPGQ
jgi:branched-chain amino acid transport system substrate-binding protein